MAGFIFGVIGFYLLKQGRKQVNYTWAFIGLALIIYPYLLHSAWLVWGLGFVLCVVAYYYR